MDVIETVRELQARADAERAAGRRIALVPTMGALHAGHLALVDEARRAPTSSCVSIFVNPAQFDARADSRAYPRTLEADLAALPRRAASTRVFMPDERELYRDGHQTWLEVGELAKPLCGAAARPLPRRGDGGGEAAASPRSRTSRCSARRTSSSSR